jgi:hypothetical protein
MTYQETVAKLLSLGFKEKTYDGKKGTFISLTQSYGNTPFFNPKHDVDYKPLLGKLVTMELTPAGELQVVADKEDCTTSIGISSKEALELVIAYYDKTKPLTNMQWCYVDINGVVASISFTFDNSAITDDMLVNISTGNKMVLARSPVGSRYVLVDMKAYTVFGCRPDFNEDGSIEGIWVDDEYTLYASLKDLSLAVEV